jgi:hypothetical protein
LFVVGKLAQAIVDFTPPQHLKVLLQLHLDQLRKDLVRLVGRCLSYLDTRCLNTLVGHACHVRVTHICAWALKIPPFTTIFGDLTHIRRILVGMLA